MQYYVGLDVSVKETSVRIVNEAGKICREAKIPSYPDDLVRFLNDPAMPVARIGLKLRHCHNGCSAGWRKPGCRWFASRPGTQRPI